MRAAGQGLKSAPPSGQKFRFAPLRGASNFRSSGVPESHLTHDSRRQARVMSAAHWSCNVVAVMVHARDATTAAASLVAGVQLVSCCSRGMEPWGGRATRGGGLQRNSCMTGRYRASVPPHTRVNGRNPTPPLRGLRSYHPTPPLQSYPPSCESDFLP